MLVGIERNAGNQDYLNFYIEGDAAGWVGVGFSSTPNMVSHTGGWFPMNIGSQ